jgi:hypothetical protein
MNNKNIVAVEFESLFYDSSKVFSIDKIIGECIEGTDDFIVKLLNNFNINLVYKGLKVSPKKISLMRKFIYEQLVKWLDTSHEAIEINTISFNRDRWINDKLKRIMYPLYSSKQIYYVKSNSLSYQQHYENIMCSLTKVA